MDINGVHVVNMTADEFHSRITDHSNGFVTLSLPLMITQQLSKEAVTVNMTKFNTVPTNMSDDMGNIVTEMVTWATSAVFSELHTYIIEYIDLYRYSTDVRRNYRVHVRVMYVCFIIYVAYLSCLAT